MFRFFLKLFLMSLPIILVLVLPGFFFIKAKEDYSVRQVVRSQIINKEILYNPCCSNQKKEYKKELIKERESEIVILGTSRVLTIKSHFFKVPENVTNAGQVITSLAELSQVQKLLSDKVKMVIIGLDPQMFNPNFVSQDVQSVMDGNKLDRFGNLLGTYWKKFYSDVFSGRVNLNIVLENSKTNNVGLLALQNLAGFRRDGSYDYGSQVLGAGHREKIEKGIRESVESLKKDRSSYLYGEEISINSLNDLDSFLSFCRENKIEVIGFLSPQPHDVYIEIEKIDDVYSYNQKKLPKEIEVLFKKNNYIFVDFSDGQLLSLNDEDFMDPVHGGESVSKKILLYLSQLSEELDRELSL